jgi:hypothetical protein
LAAKAYPFRCCSWCGTTHGLTVAHLDGQRGNDAPDNLAWLCGHCHHGLLDKGLILPKYVRGSREHWQKTRGVPVHMNALKAVATMKRKGSLSANAKKAWATRRARTATGDDVNVVGVMEEF